MKNYVVLTEKQIAKLSKTVTVAFKAIHAIEAQIAALTSGEAAPKKERKPRAKKEKTVSLPPVIVAARPAKTNGHLPAPPV
jgi:hypothetical protein